MPQKTGPAPCGPSLDPSIDCPDLDPATEVCLSSHCATPDPPEASYSERVQVSTTWVGVNGRTGVQKRAGWFVGGYGFATAGANDPATDAIDGSPIVGWFRCVSAPQPGTPTFVNDAPASGNTIADRPDLAYGPGQPRAHGILAQTGDLTAITLLVLDKGETEVARYVWDGVELNDEREAVLRRVNDGAPLARACPVTRAVWIDERPAGASDGGRCGRSIR